MTTEDGLTIRAHSLVVAAVSSLVLLRLQWRAGDRKEEIQVCLGPEVSRLGLAAVLEFAYTGAVGSLNQDSVVQIQSAALALGVHRLLDLCEQEKEGKKKMEGKKEQEKNTRISAEEQLESSLQSIRLMLEERVDCDVELEARQRTFHAHRVLLAASCDYFRGMFTSGMRESKQSSVALMFVEDVELEALLRCSYTGTLMLGWDLVFDFTSTALQFQIQPALSLCLEFLHKEIHPQSCLDVISFAEAYEMGELRELAEDFVLRHFPEVSVTPKFQDLPVDKLLWYLQSNSLCVPSELVVFQAVMAWIQSDPRQRTKLARELMETIYFPLMTFKELKEAEAQTKWLKSNVESLYETVLEDFCSIGSNGNMQYRAYLPKDNLVLVGGEGITSDYANRKPSRALWFGNSLRNHTGIIKDVEWRTLGEMPEQPRFSHEVAVLRGQLYVAGGRHYYGREDVMNSMFRYDPLENNWRRLADMQEARSNFAMLVVGETIYAIGGDTDSEVNVDSVECYCSTTDAWRFTHPLDLALSSHAASVWQEKIFISGGFSRDCQCLTSILQYHPEKGTTHISDMSQSRAHHCMETLANHLYIAGGLSYDASSLCLDQLSCEIYDPRADSWCTIAPLPIPHVGAASCILEEKLYILGGYCQEDYNESRLVHRYDPATQRWENMGRMPGANTDIRACLLQIPSHLRK
ncbi:kelch-like protein 33 isoform X2 [Denticeps clupeoides]|nr:kelch-like protein 33 isoform X2 [Denticeps clupeoides]